MGIYNPQDILDEINDIDVPGVFAPNVPTSKERLTRIKLVRQELRIAKKRLKSEQDFIKKRWDNRNRDEAEQERLELIPYNLIEAHIDRIETALVKMEAAIELDGPLPPAPPDDVVIVGGPEFGELTLADAAGVAKWKVDQLKRLDEQERVLAEQERLLIEQEKENTKAMFAEVKVYISRKDYRSARLLLAAIKHPTAREWETKLDQIEPRVTKKQESKTSYNFVDYVVTVTMIISFGGLYLSIQSNNLTLIFGLLGLIVLAVLYLMARSFKINQQKEREWRAAIDNQRQRWGNAYCDMLIEKKIALGMTQEMVLIGWGKPSYADQRELLKSGEKIRWVYGTPRYGARYVYFKDGSVTKIKV